MDLFILLTLACNIAAVMPKEENLISGEPKDRKYNLEARLIHFAILIVKTVNELPADRVGNHLGGQLLRSGTSPALNYGEAQSAESRKDFVHKLKVVLKELRETFVCLKILVGLNYLEQESTTYR